MSQESASSWPGAGGSSGYSVTSVEGCETEYPLGINPLGTILNTPDGYMSTQLAKPGLHQDD
jgi:hypothetical protein